MSKHSLQELVNLIEAFDEDHHDYREVRAAKRGGGQVSDFNAPDKLTEAIEAALVGGWSFVVQHGMDTGDNPFVTLKAIKQDERPLEITWHTRATGTYRLFHCMQGSNRAARSLSLTVAIKALREAGK